MNFLRQIHRASEILFLLTGLVILVTFLFHKNSQLYSWHAEVVLQVVDQPFVLFAAIFAMTSLRISFTHQHFGVEYVDGPHHASLPITDILLWIIALGIVGTYSYADLFLPTISSFPLLIK